MLDDRQLRSFAREGYIVVPQVVAQQFLDSAAREIDKLIASQPPPHGHQGFHFYWHRLQNRDPFQMLLADSGTFAIAHYLVSPGKLERPTQAQVALNIPPYDHRPGGPHLDGTSPPEPSGRPGTFTMLAGVLLTDQSTENTGNLWVWPGTHLTNEAFFREHGPDALLSTNGYTAIELPEPRQIRGNAGDLLLAQYMLGHNMGPNRSNTTRRALYFRLVREGHRDRWRECLHDAMLEFDAVRTALR
jgi:hypothetical protein